MSAKSSNPYLKYKILAVLIYAGVVAATIVWVRGQWPDTGEDDLGTKIAAVPGSVPGRTLVIVHNTSEDTWTNAHVLVNDTLIKSFPTVAPDEQLSIPISDFGYLYAIPRRWDYGIWKNLSQNEQPAFRDAVKLTPSEVRVIADQGEANAILDAQ